MSEIILDWTVVEIIKNTSTEQPPSSEEEHLRGIPYN